MGTIGVPARRHKLALSPAACDVPRGDRFQQSAGAGSAQRTQKLKMMLEREKTRASQPACHLTFPISFFLRIHVLFVDMKHGHAHDLTHHNGVHQCSPHRFHFGCVLPPSGVSGPHGTQVRRRAPRPCSPAMGGGGLRRPPHPTSPRRRRSPHTSLRGERRQSTRREPGPP